MANKRRKTGEQPRGMIQKTLFLGQKKPPVSKGEADHVDDRRQLKLEVAGTRDYGLPRDAKERRM